MSYYKKIKSLEGIEELTKNHIWDFYGKLDELREVMEIIGKNEITLYCSQPFNGEHVITTNKGYALHIDSQRVRFMTFEGTKELHSNDLKRLHWYDLYIYSVEIELELNRIYNHLNDCLSIRG